MPYCACVPGLDNDNVDCQCQMSMLVIYPLAVAISRGLEIGPKRCGSFRRVGMVWDHGGKILMLN